MNIKKTSRCSPSNLIQKQGFTLVEMLIVIPIIVLVVGVFVTAIVKMTGDVLSTRASNATAYNIQDALDRIEQDVNTSGGYLATNNITLASPQGYNNDNATNFHNADPTNGTMLILNTYTTTSNPLSSTRSLVYASGQPNACGSTSINQNQPVMMNVIYFVKNGTLWRRTVAPSFYAQVGCIGSSIGAPWQQPSCAPAFVTSSYPFCKTQDVELVDNIPSGGFSVNYYSSPSSTNSDATASTGTVDNTRQTALQLDSTVGVTITATNTIAGRSTSQTGTVRAISPNNNILATSQITAPTAPSGLAGVGGSGQVTLTWSAPSSNGGSAITSYKVYRGTSSGGEAYITTLGNVLTTTDTGLAASTTYYYKVTAVNIVGESTYGNSNEASALTSVP
jgi:type II secretory pathway pseudopilin PulG